MTELLQTFSGSHGKLTAVLTWIAAARLALKPFNAFLLAWFHRIITQLEANPDPFIAELAARILQNRAYRLFAFLLDTAASIKLPTVNTLRAEGRGQRAEVGEQISHNTPNQNQTP